MGMKDKKKKRIERTRKALSFLIKTTENVSATGSGVKDLADTMVQTEVDLKDFEEILDQSIKGGRILNGILGVGLALSIYKLFK